ncbi:MAG: trimeric intracellular cation channel family protein [Clostridia bacterium]|nr:trimeric intracellular cation channel family protein [Clostridia bacterium]
MEMFFTVLQYAGIIAFAVAGAMIAVDKETDLVGVVVLAVVTAFGGGIMRDLFLGHTPPRFFTDYAIELSVTVLCALAVFVFARIFSSFFINNERKINSIVNIFDAIGIGIFSVYSVNLSFEAGYSAPIVAISMGVVASVGGGLIRDIIIGDVPFILRKHIYILAALAGAFTYYALIIWAGSSVYLATALGVALTFILRMLATVFKWNLPRAIDFEKVRGNRNKD